MMRSQTSTGSSGKFDNESEDMRFSKEVEALAACAASSDAFFDMVDSVYALWMSLRRISMV